LTLAERAPSLPTKQPTTAATKARMIAILTTWSISEVASDAQPSRPRYIVGTVRAVISAREIKCTRIAPRQPPRRTKLAGGEGRGAGSVVSGIDAAAQSVFFRDAEP